MPGAAAGQGAAQQFAGHRQAVSLVFAKGQQRTKQTIALGHHHDTRVGAGLAVFVNQHAGLDAPALVVRDPHLSLRHAAGGEVQHKRFAPLERHANAAGVGAVAPVGATKRRHHRTRQHIDKMQGHQALRHRQLGKMSDASQMVRIGQRHDAAAMGFGTADAECHRLLADDLAITALPVQRQQ